MTQSPDSTTPPDGQRHVTRQVLLWCCAIAAIIGLGFWASMGVQSALSIAPRGMQPAQAHLFVTATLKTPLRRYKIDNGDYPSTAQGLQALLTPPRGTEKHWEGPYLELTPPDKMPLDAWGHVYRYAYPSIHASTASTSAGASGTTTAVPGYDVWSLGPDGIDYTADDIGNW